MKTPRKARRKAREITHLNDPPVCGTHAKHPKTSGLIEDVTCKRCDRVWGASAVCVDGSASCTFDPAPAETKPPASGDLVGSCCGRYLCSCHLLPASGTECGCKPASGTADFGGTEEEIRIFNAGYVRAVEEDAAALAEANAECHDRDHAKLREAFNDITTNGMVSCPTESMGQDTYFWHSLASALRAELAHAQARVVEMEGFVGKQDRLCEAENERLREALHWALKEIRITDLNREAFGRVSALAGGKETP